MPRARSGSTMVGRQTTTDGLWSVDWSMDTPSPRRIRSLIAAGADPDLPCRGGWTPLQAAIAYGGMPHVRALLDAGAGPDRVGREMGRTALMDAAGRGRADVAGVLIAAGADPDLVDDAGWTALAHAVDAGFDDVVGILLDAGAAPIPPGRRAARATCRNQAVASAASAAHPWRMERFAIACGMPARLATAPMGADDAAWAAGAVARHPTAPWAMALLAAASRDPS